MEIKLLTPLTKLKKRLFKTTFFNFKQHLKFNEFYNANSSEKFLISSTNLVLSRSDKIQC